MSVGYSLVILTIFLSFCFVSCNTTETNSTTTPIPHSTSEAPLKCTRDYHCPSSCDVCRSGICTHILNLSCSRDYHCPACEVCRSGKCIGGEEQKKCETENDCEAGGWCMEGRCVENKCDEDSDCAVERAICKVGVCERVS
ncbi:IGFBP N-terminal domain-containing protein [Caenorhabditis elegans]|uniref:IGFBP N-terminal domain-containing protein n=1 Tax=Caenorhabditis elegans TaxID=6239 RepID=B9ZSH4_CAEEL|nr:IGFBP N-terminal domain-containing protein [Caenorhabditis elegans]CAX51687.1 IGFBP N-terminal domain-containing protein [Caenorhabditis elegans]|eukprot:NP_001255127.1 Uncharacterized protein CELE_Y47D3B.12 [Caenorhabditis elegans]